MRKADSAVLVGTTFVVASLVVLAEVSVVVVTVFVSVVDGSAAEEDAPVSVDEVSVAPADDAVVV
jgi:hypothetical protein